MIGKTIAVHDAYSTTLKELGEQNAEIVDLETDVTSSTRSGIFGKAPPEQCLNVGINKLNMVSMVAGFAREGMIPYMNTFAVLMTTRGADPIQSLVAYDNLNVKLCGAYCGLSDSYSGTSHQTITDLAFICAIPNMTVIAAADGAETREAVFVMAEYDGLVYLRLSRAEAPACYLDDMDFQTGRGITAREGGNMIIITTGTVLHKTLETADLLVQEGISTTVVNMHTIKPIDRDSVIQCAIRMGAIVTVKEHSIYGGLSSTVAEVLVESKPIPAKRIDAVGPAESGDYSELFVKYGCSPQAIAGKCRAVIRWK